MSEFDVTDWADFVRGVADPGAGERMRAHLRDDPRARRTVEALTRVAEVGRADHDERAPEHAVRIAKAIAPARPRAEAAGAASRPGALRRLRGVLLFDSLLEPAPAGTRDLDASHRQVVYEAEAYRVDVRLEPEIEPRSTLAMGQVTSRGEDVKPVARAPVMVFAGTDEVARAVTSRFGEFQFAGLPREPLELCLVIGEDFVEIPLESRAGKEAAP